MKVLEQRLSPAEIEVALRLKRGDSNRQIAAELGKAMGTVKAQVTSILQKLGVESRARAVARLHEEPAWLEPG